jgi:predicted dinucleotide-binding enzyme
MKKILIVGAGACGLGIAKVLTDHNVKLDDVIIVTPENMEEHKEEIKRQSPFEPEPIMIHAQPRCEDVFIPRKNEKPFWQTIKKGKKKRR